jgi:hypothetical protein
MFLIFRQLIFQAIFSGGAAKELALRVNSFRVNASSFTVSAKSKTAASVALPTIH